jgi:hypothetical protein
MERPKTDSGRAAFFAASKPLRRLSSRTLVTKIAPSLSYRFFCPMATESRHGLSLPGQPQSAHFRFGICVRGLSFLRRLAHSTRKHSRTIAPNFGGRLLLPLCAVPLACRLRHDVRFAEIPLALVGHFLHQAADKVTFRHKGSGSKAASRRSRRAR